MLKFSVYLAVMTVLAILYGSMIGKVLKGRSALLAAILTFALAFAINSLMIRLFGF